MVVQGDPVGLWVSERIKGNYEPLFSVAIGWEVDGVLTAGVIFDRHNGAAISSSIAVEGSLPREFVRAILDYPFNFLKVNCVINVVSSANLRSIRLTEHFGFKRIASIPEATLDGDMLIYCLRKEDCAKFMR